MGVGEGRGWAEVGSGFSIRAFVSFSTSKGNVMVGTDLCLHVQIKLQGDIRITMYDHVDSFESFFSAFGALFSSTENEV